MSRKFFKGVCGFAGKSVSLRLGGQVFGGRPRVVGDLISVLRESAFLRFSGASAPAFGIAFGGACSVPAVGCLTSAESGGGNIAFRCGGESFVDSTFISDF